MELASVSVRLDHASMRRCHGEMSGWPGECHIKIMQACGLRWAAEQARMHLLNLVHILQQQSMASFSTLTSNFGEALFGEVKQVAKLFR